MRTFPLLTSQPEIVGRAMDHVCTTRSREGAPLPDATPGKEPHARPCVVFERPPNIHVCRTDIVRGYSGVIIEQSASY